MSPRQYGGNLERPHAIPPSYAQTSLVLCDLTETPGVGTLIGGHLVCACQGCCATCLLRTSGVYTLNRQLPTAPKVQSDGDLVMLIVNGPQ